jgi:acetyltransferase
LTTYGIPSTIPLFANNPDVAVKIASDMGYPVVIKISSPDITHKTDVEGVALNINSDKEVKKAYAKMMADVKRHRPDANLEGVTIQKMVAHADYELIIGCKKDPVLGSVIVFGRGGTETEIFRDIAVGLPPLNQKLARRVMERTGIFRALLSGFRSRPPANIRMIEETLVKVSNLIIDFPEIKELDINPIAVSGDSIYALDARVILDPDVREGPEEYPHLIISPYPTKYIQPWTCYDGRNVLLRPIRPEDEQLERELLAGLSPESSRMRFFQIIKEITHDMLSRFCNIDYSREMAIIAEYSAGSVRRNVGVSRIILESGQGAEFAIVIADDFQNTGLGLKLCDMLIGIARDKGLNSIYGIVLNDNVKMLNLARKLGFTFQRLSEEETRIELEI